jgi:hypothetical protein
MLGSQYNEFKADIAAHGIRMPILVNKKKDTIIDGRNRIMAAHDLKLPDSKIPVEVFDGTEDEVVTQIIARNIMRRHLTDDQRAAMVAKLRGPQLTKQAEARQRAGNAVLKSTQGRSWQQVATEAKVSQHKARAALETAKHAPKDLDEVIEGKTKLAAAKKKAQAKSGKKPKAKPQKTLREQVEAKFLRLMESFSPSDYREVRKILRDLLTEAEKYPFQPK